MYFYSSETLHMIINPGTAGYTFDTYPLLLNQNTIIRKRKIISFGPTVRKITEIGPYERDQFQCINIDTLEVPRLNRAFYSTL